MALDEFSSYTEALAAWLASNRQDESQLLKGKALEDAKQLVECRSLSEPDYQFLIASQELEKRELLKQLEIDRQATQEVNQQIASFLANTRIELATPINGIICSLKLIIDGLTKSREEEQAFINEAHRSALDTLAQVNGLLDIADLAQLEADNFLLELEPIELTALLTEVENSLKGQAHQKQINFQFIKSATQKKIITYGNYYRLRQVMFTLVGNAIKYTEEGGITIVVIERIEDKVMLHKLEYPGLVKIHVADNRNMYGQDSLLKFLRQMNDSFIYQWYNTPAFGMAISKKLIEAMSGKLHLDVKGDGRGATVTISLPFTNG
jgi:signal transduction histidine kinase